MKKLALLSLPLLLAACGGGSAPGASQVSVTASKTAVTLTGTDNTGTTSYGFTNKAGSKEVTISSATVSWTDPTSNAARSETVSIPSFTLPAGLSCAAAASNPLAACNYNDSGTTFADRTVNRTINDADVFGKVLAANPSVANLPVNVKFNSTETPLNFSFTSSVTTGGTPGTPAETAPKPLINVNTAGTQPYSGSISVSVSGNFDVTSKIKSLILQVTDSKGNTDSSTYVSANPNATFSIDTTKYADGTLTLKAIALTETNLRGESAVQTLQIQNVSAPTMQILSPDSGATLTGPTTVRVQLRQSTSSFALKDYDAAGNDVRIDVRDFRGEIVKTAYGQAVKISDGIYEAFIPLDLIGPDFSSNTYTITATAQATLADNSTRTLSTNTTVGTQVNDNKPPALSIVMPAYIQDPYQGLVRPIISRNTAFMIQASDDNAVTSLRVDLVCDPATAAATQTCPTAPYSYNVPVELSSVVFRVFQIGALMDGQPYVQNGNYTLRITAYDGSKANIQEMPVRVSRAEVDSEIQNLASMSVVDNIVYDTTPEELNITSARWIVPGTTTNPVRVATLSYDLDDSNGTLIPSRSRIDPVMPQGTTIALTRSFNEVGNYRVDFIVEDLVTGVTRYYEGGVIQVKRNRQRQ